MMNYPSSTSTTMSRRRFFVWMMISSLCIICDSRRIVSHIPTTTLAFQQQQCVKKRMMTHPKANSLYDRTRKSSTGIISTTSITTTTTITTAHSTTATPLSASGSYLDSLSAVSPTSSTIDDDDKEMPTATSNGNPAASRLSIKKPVIQTLDTVSDFLDYLDDAPTDALSVIEFYGKSCPLCKKVAIKYKKIANQFSKKGGVRFAQMEHPANKPVMDILEIRQFPFLHVYRNGKCVAAHGTESDKQFEYIVKDTIQRELDMTTEDWNIFLDRFDGPIQQGTDKIEQLRNELL